VESWCGARCLTGLYDASSSMQRFAIETEAGIFALIDVTRELFRMSMMKATWCDNCKTATRCQLTVGFAKS